MDFNKENNMYNVNYDVLTDEHQITIGDVNNKLFCTFTKLEDSENLIQELSGKYSIMYNKVFILEVLDQDEYVLTYSIDQGNVNSIPENTILVHRKKETNTLYTINALNELIKKLNGGVVDTSYKITWNHYKNCILLTQHGKLNQLNTKIHKIVEL